MTPERKREILAALGTVKSVPELQGFRRQIAAQGELTDEVMGEINSRELHIRSGKA